MSGEQVECRCGFCTHLNSDAISNIRPATIYELRIYSTIVNTWDACKVNSFLMPRHPLSPYIDTMSYYGVDISARLQEDSVRDLF